MSEDYTPLYSDATRDAYAGKSGQDSRDYASAVARRVDYKYDLNPAYNEILALIRGSIASGTYRQTWTCLSGDAVGDPIYISAANTVAKADATTAAKAIVVGYIRYKPTTTSCYIDHLLYKSGLSGLTPGAAVFLTDAGGFSATPGTVRREVGIAISATEALLEAYPVTGTQLHASSHITGGSDEIDGDKIDIDWTPSNYTPDSSPTEAGNVDHLTAHLKGIDTELGQKLENMVEDLTPQLGAALDGNAKDITNVARLLIGAAAFDSAASLQETISNTYAIQRILAANDTIGYGAYLYLQRARGTQASRTAPHDGDDLGAVYGVGHTGSAWGVSGGFSVLADGNHGAGSTPGKAGIWTTATGATSATQRIHVDASGKVGIAKLSALTEILDIVGNMAVSGTVDGRDIATDGSKLDGIEAGADVTDWTNVAAALAEATGVIDFNGQDLDDVGNAQIKIFCQSATPTANNNYDLWWETDARILWFWFGTRWLSVNTYEFERGFEVTAITNWYLAPRRDAHVDYDLYIVDLCAISAVASTNDASNYWTLAFEYINAGESVVVSLGSVTTASHGATGTFVAGLSAIDTHLDRSDLGAALTSFRIRASTTGSPGKLYAGVTVTYRLSQDPV